MESARDMVPVNLTKKQWELVLSQADEWGAAFEYAYPGTIYHPETLCWDYSNNEDAVRIFENADNGDCYIYTPFLAQLRS